METNEVCKTVENEVDALIAEHEKNYGEAKIYEDLNKITQLSDLKSLRLSSLTN